MVHVLRRLEGSGLLDEYPNLAAYIAPPKRGPPSSVLRRSIGGFHRCIEWLTKVRSGFKQT
jgi:hypothetical protein